MENIASNNIQNNNPIVNNNNSTTNNDITNNDSHDTTNQSYNTNSVINSNNTSIVNNNNNNNFAIAINPRGKENIDFLTDADKVKILNMCYMAVPKLAEEIHKKGYNRNFFVYNINKKIIGFLNDKNEIDLDDYDTVCNSIIDDNIDRISDMYEEHKDKVKPRNKAKLAKVIKENNEGKLNKKYIDDMKYNILKTSKRNKLYVMKYIDGVDELAYKKELSAIQNKNK